MDIKKKAGVGRTSKKQIKGKTSKQIIAHTQPSTILDRVDVVEKVVVGHAKRHFVDRFDNLRNVRRQVIVWLVLIGALMLSVGIFRFLGQSGYKNADFSDGGTYSEGMIGEVKNLNPIFAASSPERAFSELAFSRLYNVDSSGNLNTDLVSKVSTQDDYKNFTLEIRKNAFWSDGEKIDANDVVFTIKLLQDKIVNPSKYQSWQSVKVSKKDDFSMNFSMPASTSLVLHTLNFPILPEHKLKDVAVEKLRENDFSHNPVTSGAFNFKMLKNSDKKTTISLEKNAKYYRGAAKLDFFEIVAFSEKNDLKKSLASGEISASPDVKISDFSESEKSKLSENKVLIKRGVYAFLNNSSSVFKDKNVRLAVQSGLNLNDIRSEVGASKELNLPILNEFVNYGELSVPAYDAEKAKKYLDDSGWKIGGEKRKKDNQSLKITIATISDSKTESVTKNIEKQLKGLGFEVELIIADKEDKSGSFVQSILQPRNYDILVYEIGFGADHDIYAFWHSSQSDDGLNFSKYSDAISDDILVNYRKAKTDEDRKKQLTLFSKRWISQAPAIGIFQSEMEYVYRKSVETFDSEDDLADIFNRYSDVIYWQVNKTELYKTP